MSDLDFLVHYNLMFLTTHAAAGIFLSQQFDNPYAVFAAAFGSHFLLDFIPHGDEHLYHDHEWKILKKFKRAIIVNSLDLLGLLIVIFWAIQQPGDTTGRLMMVGIIGSILPDFLSYLFPIIHERMSWLWLVRWLYRLTKPTGLRYFVRAHDWMHNLLHHDIIRRDISFKSGIILQSLLILALLGLAA